VTVTVGPDGRVTIPNTHPGETITIHIASVAQAVAPTRLTLATARTDDEKTAVIAEIKRLTHELRQELDLGDEHLSRTHGELLYDENGLPK